LPGVGPGGYGRHTATAVSSPSLTWDCAGSATVGAFNLFYRLQNPSDHGATVAVRYLPGGLAVAEHRDTVAGVAIVGPCAFARPPRAA
jgi:hypothetical protein